MLPNTQEPQVPAEQCRQNIEGLQIPNEGSSISGFVTISVGVNTIIPNQNADLSEFERNTDRALYKAKETGRNKICCKTGSDEAAAVTGKILHSV